MNDQAVVSPFRYRRNRVVPFCEENISTNVLAYHPRRPSLLAFDATERAQIRPHSRVVVVQSNPLFALYAWRFANIQQLTVVCPDFDDVEQGEQVCGGANVNFELGEVGDESFVGKFDVLLCDSEYLSASVSANKLKMLMSMLRPGGKAYLHCLCRNIKAGALYQYLQSVASEKQDDILRTLNGCPTTFEFASLCRSMPEVIASLSQYHPLFFSKKNLDHHGIVRAKDATGLCCGPLSAVYVCTKA